MNVFKIRTPTYYRVLKCIYNLLQRKPCEMIKRSAQGPRQSAKNQAR